MSANHQLCSMEYAELRKRVAHHPHQRTLDERCYGIRTDGLDKETPTIMKQESFDEIQNAVHKSLSKFEGQVLERYMQGESYEVIAKRLDTPVKSVDNAIQRIRKKAIKNLF